MSSNRSSASRRAALRAQQEAEAKRKRTNRVLIAVFSVLAVVIVGIVTFVVVQEVMKTTKGTGEQISPPNATAEFGITANPGVTLKDGAPKVVIWEDFQCSYCKLTQQTFGKAFEALAAKGEIALEYRLVPMLDYGQNPNPDGWSRRSAIGAAIADKFGKFNAYTDAVYAYDGNPFSDKVLRDDIPAAIGITGSDLTEFQKLYNDRATNNFVDKTYEKYREAAASGIVHGTPTVLSNGKVADMWVQAPDNKIAPATEPTEEALLKYLKEKGA